MTDELATAPAPQASAPGRPSVSDMGLFTELSANLAAELAAQLRPAKEVIARYGLSAAEFAKLASTPAFKQMLREAQQTWASDLNAQERIRAKAAVITEEGLLVLHQIIHNTELPAPNRMDAIKHASTLADALPRKDDAGGGGNKFTVNIDLSGKDPGTGKMVENRMTIEASPAGVETDDIASDGL